VKRSGITLLETIVALSLAAMLMVALSGILRNLLRQRDKAERIQSNEWLHRLDRVFWTDLAQAKSVALNQGTLWIKTTSHENASGSSQVSVAYRLVPQNKNLSSLNRQVFAVSNIDRDTLRPQPIREQTLAWNIQKIRFERLDERGQPQPLPTSPGPAPSAFRYQLWIDSNDTPTIHQIIVR